MPLAKILALDDDQEQLSALKEALECADFEVIALSEPAKALEIAIKEAPDLVLSDLIMPGLSGTELLHKFKLDPELRYLPFILLTSKDELGDVIKGLDAGADDYIKKPFSQPELIARLRSALRTRAIYLELKESRLETKQLKRRIEDSRAFGAMIGKSAVMQSVFNLIERVKESDLPVLITGESGTGKELVADALHQQSKRRHMPFVVQNCSAFQETLLESELFGHVKGAFSGALRDKQGLFEAANGGTFFLDEIGEMSVNLQARLLRVLENGSFLPVGSTKEQKVDVRIVAATNRDLPSMISAGKFREDLYYRLNVLQVKLPALRERPGDIPLIADSFLVGLAEREGQRKNLSAAALKALCQYSWPGNIRELRNQIERAYLLSADRADLMPEDFMLTPSNATALGALQVHGSLDSALSKVESQMILAALQRLDWNKSEAARELGISRSSLISKVQQYGLEREQRGND